MARYAFVADDVEQARQAVLELGLALGLRSAERSCATADDGLAEIRRQPESARYIPFTDRALSWHTDGYYHGPQHRIQAVVMHCLSPAQSGGHNRLLDPELIYIALRDEAPELVDALMHPQAMTIPANFDPSGRLLRPACSGPVFSVLEGGTRLHMRYTARTRSIEWRADSCTREASRRVIEHLRAAETASNTLLLGRSQGIVCNNVLHTRSAFTDGTAPRRMLRARYHERVASPRPEANTSC